MDPLLERPVRRFQLTLLVLIGLIALGALGYVLLEGMSWLDAVYMTVITLTTVGFREVQPLSPAGRVFTVLLIMMGVGAAAWAARNAAEMIFGEGLWETMRRRRMQERIDRLDGHHLVCGFGRLGRQVARDLEERDEPAVIIDSDPEAEGTLEESGYLYVLGDATEDEVLLQAGVERAKGLVASLNTDADNVLTVLTARGLNPDLLIVARASTSAAVSKLERAGANRVVSPYIIGGHRLALSLLRPSVDDFLNQLFHFSDELDVDIGQLPVPECSPYAGQTLAECDLRKQWGLTVLAVQESDGGVDMTPEGDQEIAVGQTLIVIGPRQAIYDLERTHFPGIPGIPDSPKESS
ncbi:MAG: potassium channel family protein [Anaerolineales bacterium]